ncbi:DUF1707 SHOCT-like domain-containing protein [Nocardia australiensis]|uniref:DUF1707 SHOCT-like domain-containing protein n=1 Tax=Nocardia australiensis TaxID=2887191 RepID=UPI001D1577D7|nr:DUF1707 domain-containing protein [Nocardia australiensis]
MSEHGEPITSDPAAIGDPAGARVGAAERERALAELSQHLGSGRLDLSEFEHRSAVVSAATTKSQLAALFADLPGSTPPAPRLPVSNPLPRLATAAGVIVVLAVVVAIATGNWLWLLMIGCAPVVFVRLAVTSRQRT